MVDTVWFFAVVLALAGAPAVVSLWWLASSRRRDARKARVAERVAAAYRPVREPASGPAGEPAAVSRPPRRPAHHDGPCDCWEDTDVLLLRDTGFS